MEKSQGCDNRETPPRPPFRGEVTELTTPRPRAPSVRLVAIDVDGTLLRPDETVSDYTIATLQAVVNEGRKVVLVTARPPRTLGLVASQLGIEGLAICGNGSLIYDLATRAVIRKATIDAGVLADAISAIRARVADVALACEMALIFGHEEAYESVEPLPADAVSGPAEEWVRRGVTKLMVQSRHVGFDDLLTIVAEIAGGRLVVTHSSTRFVEVMAFGVTKAAALAELAVAEGVAPSQIVAFGDMPNDVPMLEWVGTAVAVANAHPAVLAVADVITDSSADDGVARYLRRLGLAAAMDRG